ncbi:MAG: hypothetical protein QXO75_10550, partial [Nitrososphaerota archaeon]
MKISVVAIVVFFSTSLISANYQNNQVSSSNGLSGSNLAPFVQNSNLSAEYVKYTLVLFNVTFTETGLNSGTTWSVTLNGATESSSTSSIIFTEPNGSYQYYIHSVTLNTTVPGQTFEYTATPYSGNVSVDGTNANINVLFTFTTTFTHKFSNLTTKLSQEIRESISSYPIFVPYKGNITVYGLNTNGIVVFTENPNFGDVRNIVFLNDSYIYVYPSNSVSLNNGILIEYLEYNFSTGVFKSYYILYNATSSINVSANFTLLGTFSQSLGREGNILFMMSTVNGKSTISEFNSTTLKFEKNLTAVIPNNVSFFFSVSNGNNVVFYGYEFNATSAIPYLALFNVSTNKYFSINTNIKFTKDVVGYFTSGLFYGSNFYFPGVDFNISSDSYSPILISYNPSMNETSNITPATFPKNYGIFNASIFGDVIILSGFGFSSGNVLYSYYPSNGTSFNLTAIIGSNFSVSSMSNLNGNFYVAGVNSPSGLCEEIEFGPNFSLLNSKVLSGKYGFYNPNWWVAGSYYGDNGFITVGGNGLSFYNGTFEAPSLALPGFLTAAAWDGSVFLVGGSTYYSTITTSTGYTYHENSGPLMALYYPNNDTLVNITEKIPTINSLQKLNGSIYQVTWNGTVFFVLGEYGNLSTGNEKLLLFTYDPITGVAKNVTDLIPLFSVSSMTGMLSTDNGTFILLYNNNRDYLYEINTQGGVENFTSIFKVPFNFNDYNGYGTPMAYGDGFLFIGGNYLNGSLFALAYNMQNKSSTNFGGAISNVNGRENQVAFGDGVFLLYGTSGNSPDYTSLLLTFDPITDQVSNISGFIPSNFANKSFTPGGMSFNGSSVFLTGGVFGKVVYGILNLTVNYTVTFTESGLPSGTTWYVNITNGPDSGAITGSSYSFSLTNGTYSYTIATSDHTYRPSQS